jgi:glycosyltransferase involved in cell wall biosynthesis
VSNILFVLYHDFSANSAVHVHNFANQLACSGHGVAVAIPNGDETGSALGEQRYSVLTYPEVDGNWTRVFSNDLPPDVLHAWTPRENVRLFCEKVRTLCSALLFIHLEDNEELILEANLGSSFEQLARSGSMKLPGNLAHPRNYRRFIGQADGVTMIMDRLEKFVPPAIPRIILWPGADRQLFFAREKDESFLASLSVPRENIVLCYTGNVHSANAREVRSLYLAAAILTREGIPTTLVRAGKDYYPFLGPDEKWAREVSVDLGYVKHVDIPRVLCLADFLIQPGTDDAFNEYRLPAKLPEFFAMGRPVLLPLTNVGRFVRHGQEAWVLPKMDALGIVEAIKTLQADEQLTSRLSAGALAFCQEHFSWSRNAATLEKFYEQIRVPKPKETNAASPVSKR